MVSNHLFMSNASHNLYLGTDKLVKEKTESYLSFERFGTGKALKKTFVKTRRPLIIIFNLLFNAIG